jgi:hypothetical protein
MVSFWEDNNLDFSKKIYKKVKKNYPFVLVLWMTSLIYLIFGFLYFF